MTIRFQRLVLILFSLILLASAVILILVNSKKNIVFFYTPSEISELDIQLKERMRLGGIIKEDSIKKMLNKNLIEFIVTDNKKEVIVQYDGILPDLFRENQGAVIEGFFIKKKMFLAERVFAKHDENYMPRSLKKQLQENDYWGKNY